MGLSFPSGNLWKFVPLFACLEDLFKQSTTTHNGILLIARTHLQVELIDVTLCDLASTKWRNVLSGKTHDISFISGLFSSVFCTFTPLRREGEAVFDHDTFFSKEVILEFSCPLYISTINFINRTIFW